TSSNLARFDGIRYGNDRSHFGAEAKRRMMLGSFTLSSGYYDDYYLKATKIRTLIKQDFENVFKKVDFIVAPTSPTPPFLIGEKMTDPLSMYLSDIFTIPVNLAGIPALSIPIGFTEEKLPLGIQLIGNIYEESKILSVGNQIEKVLGESPKVNEIKL
ncbi:MAG: amidase family protein, partial [Patescibacteria group bacterium]